jgi:hypothetical protein
MSDTFDLDNDDLVFKTGFKRARCIAPVVRKVSAQTVLTAGAARNLVGSGSKGDKRTFAPEGSRVQCLQNVLNLHWVVTAILPPAFPFPTPA